MAPPRNPEISRLVTACEKQQLAALSCVEANADDKSPCYDVVQAYKKCRKEETQRVREARGGGAAGTWGEFFGSIFK